MSEQDNMDEKISKVDETLISQDIDPADLHDPAKDKAKLADDME